MDLREAYEKLGVELGTEAKSTRRAYLRLLKKHKPETDPEGFKTIREAWERIKDAPDWEIRALTEQPLHEPLDGPDVSSWSKPQRSWSEQAQASREGRLFEEAKAPPPTRAAPAPIVEPEIDPSVPPSMARFYASCSHATDAERVAIGREAIAKLPDDPEAYWLLHESLLVTSQMQEAAAVLRGAHERGLEGFFEPLVRQHPEHLTTMEIQAAVELSGDTLDALMVAEAMLRRKEAQSAADAMRKGFEAARRGGATPNVRRCIDLVLRLYRAEHAGIASQLYARLSEWLKESGAESEIAGTQAAASYALLCELAALPGGFPFEIKASIARAILDGDVSFAYPEVQSWIAAHPTHRDDVKDKLLVFAPTLHRTLQMALEPMTTNIAPQLKPLPVKTWGKAPIPHSIPQEQNKGGRWILAAVVLFALVAVQIALKSNRTRDRSYLYNQDLLRNLQPIQPLPQGLTGSFGAPSDAQLTSAGSQLCLLSAESELCHYGRELADALRVNDCPRAESQRAMFLMEVERIRSDPNSVLGAFIPSAKGTLDRGWLRRCPVEANAEVQEQLGEPDGLDEAGERVGGQGEVQ